MGAINKVTLRGYLGKDPKWGALPNGATACRIVLATAVTERDPVSGKMVQATEWHHAILEGPMAESVRASLSKGVEVQIEGQLKTRKWADTRGVTRYITEVRADSVLVFTKPAASSTPLSDDSLSWVAAYDAAWALERALTATYEANRRAR